MAKSALERLLLRSGAASLSCARFAGRTLVLGYHNVVPDGEPIRGDRPLHLPQRCFAAQLDALRSTHEVIPLGGVLYPPESAHARPRVAITFDDAYHGAVTAGVDELVKRGLPATIFVSPAFVGGERFWWDSFAGAGGLHAGFREHVIVALQGRDRAARAWAAASGHPEHELPTYACCAAEDELLSAAGQPGITLGAHTWNHVNLASVSSDELWDELVRPLAWLRERYPSVVPWLTLPYGCSSSVVEGAVAAAGYMGAFRSEGGWLPVSEPNRLALPRLDVPAGMSLEGFRLRVSGLFR